MSKGLKFAAIKTLQNVAIANWLKDHRDAAKSKKEKT
jgi:hypothetical protein